MIGEACIQMLVASTILQNFMNHLNSSKQDLGIEYLWLGGHSPFRSSQSFLMNGNFSIFGQLDGRLKFPVFAAAMMSINMN